MKVVSLEIFKEAKEWHEEVLSKTHPEVTLQEVLEDFTEEAAMKQLVSGAAE